jgi:hypothetical protein
MGVEGTVLGGTDASSGSGSRAVRRFPEKGEVMQYDDGIRKAIAQASYTDQLVDARVQEDARIRLSYFAVTATLGILGYYVHIRSGFALDPSRISLANYLFPTGFLLLYVIMRIAHGRYREECLILDGARDVERSQKIFDGSAARKLDRFKLVGYWTPSRTATAASCCAVAIFATMLIHHWQY